MGSGAQHASSRRRPTACGAACSSWVNASDQVVSTVWLYPVGSPRASRRPRRWRNDPRYLTRLLPLAYKLIARDDSGGATGITADDWFVTEELDDTTLVLFAVVRAPRRANLG